MEIGKSSRKSLHLPEEIIEELLSRLAVKSLLKLRCVSKSWRSLIDSKRFIKTHHQNSIKNPSFPQQRVILKSIMFDRPVQCSLLSVLSEPMNTVPLYPLSDPTNTTFSRMGFQIVGSYNGLFCILEGLRRIHLWNPSSRISKKLPEIPEVGPVKDFGFGWVESSGEYKVFVRVSSYERDRIGNVYISIGKVYSSKTKSWKTIELCADLDILLTRGMFAGGKLYWKNKKYIIFLDLKSEVFGRIEMPFDQEFRVEDRASVAVLGGCLCVLLPYYNPFSHYKSGVRVWVMKESWERVATLANLVELLQPAPLVVGLKGEILVNCESMLLVYDRWDKVFRVCVDCLSFVYVESLVSPEDV